MIGRKTNEQRREVAIDRGLRNPCRSERAARRAIAGGDGPNFTVDNLQRRFNPVNNFRRERRVIQRNGLLWRGRRISHFGARIERVAEAVPQQIESEYRNRNR